MNMITPKTIGSRALMLILILLCSSLTAIVQKAHAQVINFTAGYPKFDQGTLVMLEEERTLTIRFTITGADLPNAAVAVTLPDDVDYTAANVLTSGVTINPTLAGRVLTLTVTSNGGTLPKEQEMQFEIKMRADCRAEASTTLPVKVMSGSTSMGTSSAPLNIARPQVTLVPDGSGIVSYTTPTETKTIAYYLRTTTPNGASSARLTFTISDQVTAANFKLNGTPLTPTVSPASAGMRTYTLDFPSPAAMGGSKITNANDKKITFTATGSAVLCGQQTITSTVQYPHATPCGPAQAGPNVTLNISTAGQPTFKKADPLSAYVPTMPFTGTPIPQPNIPMDGTTLTYLRGTFKNTSSAAARSFQLSISAGAFGWIDTTKLYVQVDNNPPRKVSSRDITAYTKLIDNTSNGYIKPALKNKPAAITFVTEETIPAGSTLKIYAGTYNGDIRDNGNRDVYYSGYLYINRGSFSITKVEGFCGNKWNASDWQSFSNLSAAHYVEKPGEVTFKRAVTKVEKIRVVPGSVKHAPTTLTVEAPTWLTISNIKLTQDEAGTSSFHPSVSVTYNTLGPNKREVVITSTGSNLEYPNCYLHVTYTSSACASPPTNRDDTVHYTASQRWAGTTINRISQVAQPVHHLCDIPGIELDTFYLMRRNIGYKDLNDDHNLDDGSLADPDSIDNNKYLVGDTGELRWEGTVSTSGGPYHYIDMPIDLTVSSTWAFTFGAGNKTITPDLASAVVTIDGSPVPLPVSYTPVTPLKGYFRVHNTSGFPAGKKVKIHVPFTTHLSTSGVISEALIRSEFYVSKNPVTNPNDPASLGRVGTDVATVRARVLSPNWGTAAITTPILFTTRAAKTGVMIGRISMSTENFVKESRLFSYPKYLTIELPTGYTIDDTLNIYKDVYGATYLPISSSYSGSGTRTVKWKLDAIYQKSPLVPSPFPTNKWRMPEETWHIRPQVTLRVNPTVPGFKDTAMLKFSCELYDPLTDAPYINKNEGSQKGQALVLSREIPLVYSPSVKLNVTPAEVPSFGPTVRGPQISMENNSADALKDVYYFFDGPIKNVSMKQVVGGSTPYTHATTTPNKYGCWVKVADLPAHTRHVYDLQYTDTAPQCSGHMVKVYVGSGYSGTWTPNTAQAFNPADQHFVEQDSFIIKPSTAARITGEIRLFNPAKPDTIPEGSTNPAQTYTIRASLSSAGDGMVRKPELQLTVPMGQIYVPGSAQIEYPIGKFYSVPTSSNLEAVLATLSNAADSAGRPKTVRLKLNETGVDSIGTDFILPGDRSKVVDADSIYLQARLHLKFRAMCNTPFRGIQYTGKVYAENICNAAATDNGNDASSFMIYPDVAYDYLFSGIDVQTTSQSYAYNEGWRRDTIVLKFKRILGTTTGMKSTDYLEVLLPPQMNIDGDSIKYLGSGSMATLNARPKDSVMENTRTATFRRLKLPFPIVQYNMAPIHGVGADIQCRIPVVYTPEGQTRAPNPVDSVQATIWSELHFGGCPPVPTDFGNGKHKVGLFTAVAYPHIAWIGDTARFEITSHGFTGQWYKTKTGGSAATSANPWVNIPLDTGLVGDTVLYFTPSINGTSFGSIRLPYLVRIWLRPWFIRNLPRFAYFCEEPDTLHVKAGGMDVRYQWFKDDSPIVGATDTTLVVNQSGRYHVMVRDSVTPPNIIYSDTCDVYFREIPVITKDLRDLRDCDKIYLPLAVRHTGRFMQYQWYRNGRPIPGATDSVYRASAYDSSSFYRVRIMNPCGDSVMSRRCYVDFCDDRWDPIVRTVDLFAPATVETQPAGQRHQLSSRRDFRFTLRARRGQSLRYVTITVDHPAWTENGGGIERTMSSDSVMTVVVRRVTHNLQIRIGGITPTANAVVDDATRRVWTHKGRLHFRVDRPQSARLYTVMGHLYRELSLPAGSTVIDGLPSGFYIVHFADGTAEKVRVE